MPLCRRGGGKNEDTWGAVGEDRSPKTAERRGERVEGEGEDGAGAGRNITLAKDAFHVR